MSMDLTDLIDAQKYRIQEAASLRLSPKAIFAVIDEAEARGRTRGLDEALDVLRKCMNDYCIEANPADIAYQVIKDL